MGALTFLGLRRKAEPRKRKLSRAWPSERADGRAGGLWTLRHSAVSWAGLAAVAIIYLGSLVAFDELDPTNRLGPKSVADRLMSADPEQPARAGTRTSESDDATLRAGLIKLTAEVRALRSTVKELNRHKDTLESRLATLENALGPMTSSLPKAEVPKRKPPASSVSVAMSPMPSKGFSDTGLRGSPVPVAVAAPPTRTKFAVELGTGPTAAALTAKWRALRGRHGGTLGQLQARGAKAARGAGPTAKDRMRLLVGPFKNAAGAVKLCTRLQAADTRCKVTVFSGKPL
ncbi:MAG: hypothetical protein ACR2PO_16505 [Methyloligellaceae bacterium]